MQQFNCNCVTLDRDQLQQQIVVDSAVSAEAGSPSATENLVSEQQVYLNREDLRGMQKVIAAVEHVCANPHYKQTVLQQAPAITGTDFGPRGVLMGYDFHLTEDGPQLIEVNTNAGGGLINASASKAQVHCCAAAQMAFPNVNRGDADFLKSFVADWRYQRGEVPLNSIAIIDQQPANQFLYQEFLLFKRLFEQHGISVVIASPSELRYTNGKLWFGDTPIDLVYNRCTDFYFEESDSQALCDAYLASQVVVTPNPHLHALYANKRNMVYLSSLEQLQGWGIDQQHIDTLSNSVPQTVELQEYNRPLLWEKRKQLFFKPLTGYGGKAVYRGDKITKKVWNSLTAGEYIAQQRVPPSQLQVSTESGISEMKVDIRNFVYDGRVQLVAARLYQGQTTNMRTVGGGFTPVLKDQFSLRRLNELCSLHS